MTDSAKCYCVMKLGGRVVRAPVPSHACPIHHDKCKVCWGSGKIKGWSGEEDETCPECAGSGAAIDSTGGADARIRQLEQYGHDVKQDLATVEERCAELSRNLEESISIGARAETARIEAERNADRLATEKLGLLDEVKLARVGWGAMVDALQLRNDIIGELRAENEKLRGELADANAVIARAERDRCRFERELATIAEKTAREQFHRGLDDGFDWHGYGGTRESMHEQLKPHALAPQENTSMKPRTLATLPNRRGYRFTGVFYDGSHRDCVVEVDAAGNHTVADYASLRGWLTNEEHNAHVAQWPLVKPGCLAAPTEKT